MIWPRVAAYRFRWPDDSFITAYPDPNAAEDVVWDTYRRSVLPMAMQASGWEALHASGVVADGGVVAFCAVSETGKSTMAYGLSRRGFPQWADDCVIVGDLNGMAAVPLPFEARLRDDARDVLGGILPAHSRFQFNGPGEQVHTAPRPIKAVCVLRRERDLGRDGSPQIRPMAPADAFTAALTHAHEFDRTDEARRARMVHGYLQLIAEVPAFELTFQPEPGEIESLFDVVIDRLELERPRDLVGAAHAG
jgi:hypothetical protein